MTYRRRNCAPQRPNRNWCCRSSCRLNAIFAFLASRDVKAAEIVKAALSADRVLITHAGVFDVYEGKGIPEGKKSVAISVTLQPRERTLTEAEIDAVAAKIVAEVGEKTGASLRG